MYRSEYNCSDKDLKVTSFQDVATQFVALRQPQALQQQPRHSLNLVFSFSIHTSQQINQHFSIQMVKSLLKQLSKWVKIQKCTDPVQPHFKMNFMFLEDIAKNIKSGTCFNKLYDLALWFTWNLGKVRQKAVS